MCCSSSTICVIYVIPTDSDAEKISFRLVKCWMLALRFFFWFNSTKSAEPFFPNTLVIIKCFKAVVTFKVCAVCIFFPLIYCSLSVSIPAPIVKQKPQLKAVAITFCEAPLLSVQINWNKGHHSFFKHEGAEISPASFTENPYSY